MLDRYGGSFWAFVALGILAVSITRAAPRRWCLAAINLAALAVLLREQVAAVVAGVVASWLAFRLIASGRTRTLALAAGGSITLVLFLIHKRPDLLPAVRWPRLSGMPAILGAVGFSYAWRHEAGGRGPVDSQSGRQPPPSLPATVNYLVPFHMLLAGADPIGTTTSSLSPMSRLRPTCRRRSPRSRGSPRGCSRST